MVRSKERDLAKPDLAPGPQNPERIRALIRIHTAARRVGQELCAQTHAQHRLFFRENPAQKLDLAGKKRVARVGDVSDAHRPAHDHEHVADFQGSRHGRPSIESHGVHPKPPLLAEVGDESRSFAIEMLKNDGSSHGILSAVIR
jgi:hypothetical protein